MNGIHAQRALGVGDVGQAKIDQALLPLQRGPQLRGVGGRLIRVLRAQHVHPLHQHVVDLPGVLDRLDGVAVLRVARLPLAIRDVALAETDVVGVRLRAHAEVQAREGKARQRRHGQVVVGDGDVDRLVVRVRVVRVVLRVVVAVPGRGSDETGGVFFLVAVRLGRSAVDVHAREQDQILRVGRQRRERRGQAVDRGGRRHRRRMKGRALEEQDEARHSGERRAGRIAHGPDDGHQQERERPKLLIRSRRVSPCFPRVIVMAPLRGGRRSLRSPACAACRRCPAHPRSRIR